LFAFEERDLPWIGWQKSFVNALPFLLILPLHEMKRQARHYVHAHTHTHGQRKGGGASQTG